MSDAPSFRAVAEAAAEYVRPGMTLGLGTGRAAAAFLEVLGARVRQGLAVRGVPTSERTRREAERLGIPLTTFEDVSRLDVAVDGADEVDPGLNLIKGHGGALLREKIVASAADRLIIVVGREKLVPRLGATCAAPIEVLPFAAPLLLRRLGGPAGRATLRKNAQGSPVVTDNGHHILDCALGEGDPAAQDAEWHRTPGVVETGLFLGMASLVLVQYPDRVAALARPGGVPA